MRRDAKWPARCTLTGCSRPDLRPHHHHLERSYECILACQCVRVDQPGTRPIHLDDVTK